MDLKLLCVGDIVGSPGRAALQELLPSISRREGVTCNIVNAENASSGSGLTPAMYDQILACGVHLMTLGDHVYRRREIIPVLERSRVIVRPANLPPTAPGREYAIHETNTGHRVAVVCILGRQYMRHAVDCPFRTVDRVLGEIPRDVNAIVVEVHAEATSEKVAMGWHLDGRVSVVFGTHTHVPTADCRVLPGGTAYITDLGMTGPYDSVLGRRKDQVLSSLVTSVPVPYQVASEDVRLCGLLATVNSTTGRATAVQRVEERASVGSGVD